MMEKEIQRKKKVLIDLTNYGSLTAGFGQIAANYAAAFSSMPVEDIHFVYLLRQKYMQEFGPNVTSVPVRRTKFIFTIHDFNFLTEKKPWKAKMYLRRMQNKVNKAAVVTTISHYVADVIRQHIDLKGKEIRVIYNGVERIDMLEGTQPSFATGRPFFFTIGQIRRKKNFHLLVDVMRHFPEYDLYICGDAHFAYAEEVRNLIREKQVTNVFLTDVITQSEKIWLYRSCEAFLFPSEGEGLGLPVVEAMQFGKAVFAANRTSLPEVCNGHAIMWEHLDTESMVQSIREHLPDFYKDEERLTRMKEHAASFSYEKHIQAYLDLYRELAQLS